MISVLVILKQQVAFQLALEIEEKEKQKTEVQREEERLSKVI